MPSNVDGDALVTEMIASIRDMTAQLGRVRSEVKEDTAQLLRSYREDTHRSIMSLYTRLVSVEDEIRLDRKSRVTRQEIIDRQLQAIHHNQRFWIRAVIAAALIITGIVIGIWVL